MTPFAINSKESNKGYTQVVIRELLTFTAKMKALKLGFLIPKPVFFFGERSIYLHEREKYNSLYGKVMRKLAFPLRRGNWLRFIARYRNRHVNQEGSFNPDFINNIEFYLESEKHNLLKLLGRFGKQSIPDMYEPRNYKSKSFGIDSK